MTTFTLGESVQVRNWYADDSNGDYRTWTGPWLNGTVVGFNKYGHPWVVYRNKNGYADGNYFDFDNVRRVENKID